MPPYTGTIQAKRARRAASRRGLPANLSFDEWVRICADLEYRCVYCGRSGSTIDHFVPMIRGGGSTASNCVLSCTSCNQAKGPCEPQYFLAHDPEKFLKIQYYLAHRRSWSKKTPFWSLELPKEDKYMNSDEMQSTPYTLASGVELSLYNDRDHTILKFRRPLASESDPLATSIQIATLLTPLECVQLATTLLLYASPKVETKQQSRFLEEYALDDRNQW